MQRIEGKCIRTQTVTVNPIARDFGKGAKDTGDLPTPQKVGVAHHLKLSREGCEIRQ